MATAVTLLVITQASLMIYALFAGADFGAGIWDLLAGTTHAGHPRRKLIEHVIGPVWEANHVWLVFVLVLLWTAFPTVFAAVASTLWIPFTLAALGIIARGSAFAFRKAVTEVWQRRIFGATFAASSLLTPFFLGTAAGAIATGRVPLGVAAGHATTAWTSPACLFTGVLSVCACAFLAATYLCGDAARAEDACLVDWFRRRALVSGVMTGALAIAGLLVVRTDSRALFDGLFGKAAPATIVSVAGGIAALLSLALRQFLLARIAGALAVAGLVWSWGIAQYPNLLPGVAVKQAAAASGTLTMTLWVVIIGSVVLVPSMACMFYLFQQPPTHSR